MSKIFVIAHSERFPLRDVSERVPWGRSPAVQRARQAQFVYDGSARTVADTHAARLAQREEQSHRYQCSAPQRGDGPPEPWRHGTPVSPVRGMDDGFPAEVDKARLKALGNAVVPQCAEVVGHIIQELRSWP